MLGSLVDECKRTIGGDLSRLGGFWWSNVNAVEKYYIKNISIGSIYVGTNHKKEQIARFW